MKGLFYRLLIVVVFSLATINVFSQSADTEINHPNISQLQNKQFESLPELAQWISEHFDTDKERLWAIFNWVGKHISYDVSALSKPPQLLPTSQIVQNAFLEKTAVCEGYAGLMDSLSRLLEIPSHTVSGYTRNHGKLNPEPHMWVISFVDNEWQLSDPTWGAGALNLKNMRYEARFNPDYFLKDAKLMQKSHMPYDPLWQLVNPALSHKGFVEENMELSLDEENLTEQIDDFIKSSLLSQYQDELRRIQQQNYSYPPLDRRSEFLKNNIRAMSHNNYLMELRPITDKFNRAVEAFNKAVNLFNQRAGKEAVSIELQTAASLINEVRETFESLTEPPASLQVQYKEMQQNIPSMERNIEDFRSKFMR